MLDQNLGNTDIKISKLCVGCLSFGKIWLWVKDVAYVDELYLPDKIVGAL